MMILDPITGRLFTLKVPEEPVSRDAAPVPDADERGAETSKPDAEAEAIRARPPKEDDR